MHKLNIYRLNKIQTNSNKIFTNQLNKFRHNVNLNKFNKPSKYELQKKHKQNVVIIQMFFFRYPG